MSTKKQLICQPAESRNFMPETVSLPRSELALLLGYLTFELSLGKNALDRFNLKSLNLIEKMN
ncbi:MAG TPA: hypothetical protein PLB52_03050 [Candidatus Moranbacteria bacterium]|nr:hypothetical protein [Candidatus Moranbacteria bacterium]